MDRPARPVRPARTRPGWRRVLLACAPLWWSSVGASDVVPFASVAAEGDDRAAVSLVPENDYFADSEDGHIGSMLVGIARAPRPAPRAAPAAVRTSVRTGVSLGLQVFTSRRLEAPVPAEPERARATWLIADGAVSSSGRGQRSHSTWQAGLCRPVSPRARCRRAPRWPRAAHRRARPDAGGAARRAMGWEGVARGERAPRSCRDRVPARRARARVRGSARGLGLQLAANMRAVLERTPQKCCLSGFCIARLGSSQASRCGGDYPQCRYGHERSGTRVLLPFGELGHGDRRQSPVHGQIARTTLEATAIS